MSDIDLSQNSFLLTGQLKTSRTETIEDYLKPRADCLSVVGFMSPFSTYNESRCTTYMKGVKNREFNLPSFSIKKFSWRKMPLMTISFFLYVVAFFISLFKINKKFDYFIGVAAFSSLLGLLAKKLGYVNKLIYYCIDYYPKPENFSFDSIVNFIYKHIDILLVKNADILWEISPRIKEGRERYMGLSSESYKSIITPLGYSEGIDYDLDFNQRWPLNIGFIGTLSENQGLQLVIESMPSIVKIFPGIKVQVIGHGPYSETLKKMCQDYKVEKNFIFNGFIKDDKKVFDILSHCCLGLATWITHKDDNIVYADPGKPKLYALLGLPTIITKSPHVSEMVKKFKAGEVIDYDKGELISAVRKIILNADSFKLYREGVSQFKPYCLAANIFDQSFSQTKVLLS